MKQSNNSLLFHLLIFFLVFSAALLTNFPFNSWYTGWDNLHPEFDFGLNFTRALNAVWQKNQGLGTYGGHGYAATLPHTALLWLMSFIIPTQFLRASFTFLALFLGGTGLFFLLRTILEGKNEDLRNKASLFGALFYILNFGTVQNFYIQLEAFIVHFAALPWLFLSLINLIQKWNRKNLLVFIAISVLSTIQGFLPQLFVVYVLLFLIFLFFFTLENLTFERIKKSIIILILTFLVNAYWFIPVAYYTFTRSQIYINAYNNLASTEDFILKNQKYGDPKNISILKGFLSQTIDTLDNGNVFGIFTDWNKHLDNPIVQDIGYLMFIIILIGFLYLTFKRKTAFYYKFLIVGFIITLSLLATDTPPFSFLSKILQEIPVAKQAFRVSFTKLSISVSFFYAIAFGIGIFAILSKIKKNYLFLLLIIFSSLIYFSSPIFKGDFLYSRTKIDMPQIYFNVLDFFKKEDQKGRIANLPQGWNWGWSIYKWGYSGSGFLWYGIKQPIMDRAFDVWGKYNENYYWEISYALYSENFNLLDKIMDKYRINWILLDQNIVPYMNPRGFLYLEELKKYLDQSKKYQLVKKFEDPKEQALPISVYKIQLNDGTKSKQNIGPLYDYANIDQGFYEFGSYYTDLNKSFDVYYPFRSLSTNRASNNLPFKIENQLYSIAFSKPLQGDLKDYLLYIPDDKAFDEYNLKVFKNDQLLSLNIPKDKLIRKYESKNDKNFLNHSASNGTITSNDSFYFQQKIVDGNLRFISYDSNNYFNIILPALAQREAYLLQIESRHLKGKRLDFFVANLDSKKTDIELPLTANKEFREQFIIIPPMKHFGLGYSFGFNNSSIGNKETINELKSVNVYQIPYSLVLNTKMVKPQVVNNSREILSNYQSFDPGWKAYSVPVMLNSFQHPIGILKQVQNDIYTIFPFLFGTELKDHVLVNNWANGWLLPNHQSPITNHQSLIIIFWPQYLEYLGFFLLGLSFLFVCKTK